jgi:sporulation protein YlmC with PRC-barrel domain
MRASDVLGRRAVDGSGRDLGRIVDIVCEIDTEGRPELVAVLAVHGPWGRLLGYEREQVSAPWIIEKLATWILRRRMTTVPWRALRWGS